MCACSEGACGHLLAPSCPCPSLRASVHRTVLLTLRQASPSLTTVPQARFLWKHCYLEASPLVDTSKSRQVDNRDHTSQSQRPGPGTNTQESWLTSGAVWDDREFLELLLPIWRALATRGEALGMYALHDPTAGILSFEPFWRFKNLSVSWYTWLLTTEPDSQEQTVNTPYFLMLALLRCYLWCVVGFMVVSVTDHISLILAFPISKRPVVERLAASLLINSLLVLLVGKLFSSVAFW